MTYMYTLHIHNPKPTLTLYLDYMIYIYMTHICIHYTHISHYFSLL